MRLPAIVTSLAIGTVLSVSLTDVANAASNIEVDPMPTHPITETQEIAQMVDWAKEKARQAQEALQRAQQEAQRQADAQIQRDRENARNNPALQPKPMLTHPDTVEAMKHSGGYGN